MNLGVEKTSALTILINHPSADDYLAMIGERFPQVRAIAAPDAEQLEQHIGEAEALLSFRFPVEVFDKARRLRWFQSTGAGVDSMFPIRDRAGHLTVTNARGIHGDLMADYVLAGATMLHWNFRGFLRDQMQRTWNPRPIRPLGDMTLGVVGLGAIGTTIARRAKSAGMTVVGSKRDISVPVEGVDRLFAADALAVMLPLCDFVVLAMPATPDTLGFIGAAEIAQMRRGAFLINIARGSVVVESELVEALHTGVIAGALLDVFEKEPLPHDSPLWDMPNVIITPHASGTPTEYTRRAFPIVAENIDRYLKGQPLKNLVDLRRGY